MSELKELYVLFYSKYSKPSIELLNYINERYVYFKNLKKVCVDHVEVRKKIKESKMKLAIVPSIVIKKSDKTSDVEIHSGEMAFSWAQMTFMYFMKEKELEEKYRIQEPLESTPIQQTPIQQTPIQQTLIQQTPIQTPIQQIPIQQPSQLSAERMMNERQTTILHPPVGHDTLSSSEFTPSDRGTVSRDMNQKSVDINQKIIDMQREREQADNLLKQSGKGVIPHSTRPI